MSYLDYILLPPMELIGAACLLFLVGRVVQGKRNWEAAALFALTVAVLSLWYSSQVALPMVSDSSVFQDDLSIGVQYVCLIWGLLWMLAAVRARSRSEHSAETCGLFLLIVAGLLLVAMARNLTTIYLSLELIALPTFLLLSFDRHVPQTRHPATSFLVMHIVSSIVLLYGFSFLYGLAGTTDLAAMREILNAANVSGEQVSTAGRAPWLAVTALTLIVAGLGIKAFLVPFHFTTPEILQDADTWKAGLAAVCPQAASLLVLMRIGVDSLVGVEQTTVLLLAVLAMATMTLGTVMAVHEVRIRKILAWLAIADGGFVLLGPAAAVWTLAHSGTGVLPSSFGVDGIQAALLFLLTSLMARSGLFLVLVYLERDDKRVEFLDDLRGLIRVQPLAAIIATVCLGSLLGAPLFPGFWARLAVFLSVLNAQMTHGFDGSTTPNFGFLLLAVVAAVNVIITGLVVWKLVSTMMFAGPISRPRPSGGRPVLSAAAIITIVTVGCGLVPGPLFNAVGRFERPRRHAMPTSKSSNLDETKYFRSSTSSPTAKEKPHQNR